MPGPAIVVPDRVVLTSVPSGKTVSRCALITRCGRGCAARPVAEDVSDRIDSDVLQPETLEGGTIGPGAQLLGERRRRDFAQASLFVQDAPAR